MGNRYAAEILLPEAAIARGMSRHLLQRFRDRCKLTEMGPRVKAHDPM
jgi:hypothetical protein